MIRIFVNRALSPGEMDEIRDFRSKGAIKFFAFNELSPEMQNMGFLRFELPSGEKTEINKRVLKTVVGFGDKIIGNKSVSDWMMVDNAGVWYYQRFRTYHFLRELAYESAAIEILSHDCEQLICYSNNPLQKDYSGYSSKVLIKPGRSVRSNTIRIFSLFNYVTFVFIRFLISFFRLRRVRKTKHLVLDHAERQTCLDIKSLTPVKDNYILSYLFNKLDHEFTIVNFATMPRFLSGGKFKIRKSYFSNIHKDKPRLFGEYFYLKAALSITIWKKIGNASAYLTEAYAIIERASVSVEEKMIISQYKALHKTTLFYLFKYFSFEAFFNRSSFLTVSSIDENSPGIKSVMDAAKKHNVKTVGLQHGAISDLSIAYIYSASDIEKNTITDFTLVWGERWKDMLINDSHYPEKSIVITGQVRTDIIPKLQSVDKRWLENYLDDGRKLIVFASQPQPDPKQRMQAALDVFSSVKDLNDVFLIVKLHPGERNDVDYYNKLAKQANCSNYKLIYDIDLFLLISACDILITCYSTVGTETVYFYKPLIIHDPLKVDMQSYHKEGVAFQATNDKELKEFITKILNGELNINKEAYDRFISAYAYRIDGKSGERCLNFIRSL